MSVLLTTWMALLRYEVKARVNPPMLPPFIIEQIRKRESEERTRPVQPQLELPIAPLHPPHRPSNQDGQEENKRGVVIVELGQ